MCRLSNAICYKYYPKNGEYRFHRAVKYVGLEKVRYPVSYRSVPLISEPFFGRGYNLCILYGCCCQDLPRHHGRGRPLDQP